MQLTQLLVGAPRPEAAAAGPYRAALPRARAPPARFSLSTAFAKTRRVSAHAGYGPMALDHADHDVRLRPSDDAGPHHEAGPWSASRSRPPEGAEGKGGSARQTHDKASVPFQGMDWQLVGEINF